MKTNIHPNYQHDTIVTCACGNTFTTGSTKAKIKVDICSACHPFFTGEMKFIDTQGRVEKFQQKMQKSSKNFVSKKQRRTQKKQTQSTSDSPKTLRDMLSKKSKKAVKQ